jgi:tetratricopeptide (TPR) repeat protein
MSKAAQLKKKASEFEQKKQYDRALAMYIQAIEAAAGLPDEVDIPIYNRVGDLYLRLGDLEQAVAYYDMAVDLYAEGGFFNNAIALCNKILRHSPSRSAVYYKLGKISASKGFNSDAKQNFLEYADRMQKDGDPDEAFRALKEFADLCPGQDEVRLMLADQLVKADRKEEALEQLQIVYNTMVAESRTTEAAATLERMRALDPAAAPEPREGRSQPQERRDGLVFIDVNYEAPPDDLVEVAEEVPLSLPEEASVDGRPLTASEFGEVELPEPHDTHVDHTLSDSPLSGLEVSDPLSALAASIPTEPETPEPFNISDATSLPPDVLVVEEPLIYSSGAAEALAQNLDDPFGHDVPAVDYSGLHDVASILEPESEPEPVPISEALPLLEPGSILDEAINPSAIEAQSILEPEPESPSPHDTVAPHQAEDITVVPPPSDDDFVDLQKWLAETEPPKNPRMTAESEEPEDTNQVQTDFSDMLNTFKRGIAQNVDDSDADSHYDLGVAYMEMELTDEAISQFQRVIRSDAPPERRMRAYESLGQCFIERQQYAVAATALTHALQEPRLSDDKLIGVLFLLGYTAEMQQQWHEALNYYQRVFAADIHFRDVEERLTQVRRHVQGSV